MKVRNSKLKVRRFGRMLLLLAVCCLPPSMTSAGERWQGVDEAVIEKYAKEFGREAREPVINTDQGDLLLFVFLLAGAVGGFIGGYYWRALTEKKTVSQFTLPPSTGPVLSDVRTSTGSARTGSRDSGRMAK